MQIYLKAVIYTGILCFLSIYTHTYITCNSLNTTKLPHFHTYYLLF